MRVGVVLSLFLVVIAASARADEPADAINRARTHIAAKQFREAIDDLSGALAAADRLPAKERAQASAAIHFYSAVALASTGREDDAREHLEKMIELSPNARLTGADRYDRRFVALFNEVTTRLAGMSTFENLYPGFAATAPAELNITNSTAISLLASKREKQQWDAIMSTGDREKFLSDFWRLRDTTPDTAENEFRDAFSRRVAFADTHFASADATGALSDRGRVFVLLGFPSRIQRRPITMLDRIFIFDRNEQISGTIEQWLYTRDQLPIAMAKKDVRFRFVTQKGIGENVLQREDAYAMEALAVAAKTGQDVER